MDLFRTPSAGFDDPLEILDACHERVRRFSTLAVRIAEHIRDHGADGQVREAAASVMRYFDEAGPNHHKDEELDLFPLIAAAAPDLVGELRRQHRELEALWGRTREGLANATLEASLAQEFVDAYARHIALEEKELLPLARRMLDARTIAALGRAMAVRRGVA